MQQNFGDLGTFQFCWASCFVWADLASWAVVLLIPPQTGVVIGKCHLAQAWKSCHRKVWARESFSENAC